MKDYKPLILLRENKEIPSDNTMLLEAAHAFDEQYIWARKCAEIIYKCIEEGKTRTSVAFKGAKDTTLKGAYIKKITTNSILKTNASILDMTSNGYIIIEINTLNDILAKNKETSINEVWDAIVHELGHGNIYWRRYNNKQNINDTPEDYGKWHGVISNNEISANDIAYMFCYALYSTYYHEIQAFVSQTYSDTVANLNKLYGVIKNPSKEQFWKALTETNTYQAYKNNLYIADKLLESSGLRAIMIRKLMVFGLNYTDAQVVNKSKEIKDKSNDALKAAYNSAYQWFYKSFKD